MPALPTAERTSRHGRLPAAGTRECSTYLGTRPRHTNPTTGPLVHEKEATSVPGGRQIKGSGETAGKPQHSTTGRAGGRHAFRNKSLRHPGPEVRVRSRGDRGCCRLDYQSPGEDEAVNCKAGLDDIFGSNNGLLPCGIKSPPTSAGANNKRTQPKRRNMGWGRQLGGLQ